MANYTLESNQYIPHKGTSLPSGMPACRTYYYFKNEKGQVVDVNTLKPYRGKQMNRIWLHNQHEAEQYLKLINSTIIEYTENKGKTWEKAFHNQTIGGVCGTVSLTDFNTKEVKLIKASDTRMIVKIG